MTSVESKPRKQAYHLERLPREPTNPLFEPQVIMSTGIDVESLKIPQPIQKVLVVGHATQVEPRLSSEVVGIKSTYIREKAPYPCS